MKDLAYDLLMVALGTVLAKVVDEVWEVVKEKASPHPTKNDKEA